MTRNTNFDDVRVGTTIGFAHPKDCRGFVTVGKPYQVIKTGSHRDALFKDDIGGLRYLFEHVRWKLWGGYIISQPDEAPTEQPKSEQWIGSQCDGECSDPGSRYCRCYLMRSGQPPARTDTERLDWLERQPKWEVCCDGESRIAFYAPSLGPWDNAREAIDAAMDREARG